MNPIRRLELASSIARSGELRTLFVAGLSFKTAPVEVREQLAVHASRLRCHGCRLKLAGNLAEVVLLSTCNRVEVYGLSNWPKGNAHRLFEALCNGRVDFTPYLYVKEGAEAVRHLFSVASGLDSMVIGETEITGQVKQAYQAAQNAKLTGPFTNRLFQTALQVAKEVRTSTAVGRGATSVGSVAVKLAEKIFGHNLSDRSVMIIGAGKMGEACLRHISKKGTRSVIVANRSRERAEHLAAEFGGRAVDMKECFAAMAEADIVVSSTGSPHTIIHREELAAVMTARRNRPLFLIDIAVPRDIAPEVQELESVYLYNVDHLENLVKENVRIREQELLHCREIVATHATAIMQRFGAAPRRPAIPVQLPQEAWDLHPALAT
ncbi:MAG TPA: glutamyl-tRNA reductase [Clostridia bacterium]|nr:glutamyl-tRNA reductase [Clostridia bacterium]